MAGRAGYGDGVLSVPPFPAKVRVRFCADGSALVQTPASDMGMGTATAQIQHAADRLGLPMHRVNFQYGDSRLPDTPILAGGSNQTATMFAAVREAVEQIHRELLKLAHKRSDSPLHGAKYEEVEARNGGLFRRGDRASGETYAAVLQKAGQASVEAEPSSGPPMELMKYSMASYGAQFCEVRVDEETGEVRVSSWLWLLRLRNGGQSQDRRQPVARRDHHGNRHGVD